MKVKFQPGLLFFMLSKILKQLQPKSIVQWWYGVITLAVAIPSITEWAYGNFTTLWILAVAGLHHFLKPRIKFLSNRFSGENAKVFEKPEKPIQ